MIKYFSASFVQDYSTYWVGVESEPVVISGNTITVMTTPAPPTSARPPTTPYYDLPINKKVCSNSYKINENNTAVIKLTRV